MKIVNDIDQVIALLISVTLLVFLCIWGTLWLRGKR